jgi:hypothetical protein
LRSQNARRGAKLKAIVGLPGDMPRTRMVERRIHVWPWGRPSVLEHPFCDMDKAEWS